MLLIAVGKLGQGPERGLFERYAARLRPALAVREVSDGRGAPLEIKRREAGALLGALPASALAVALDLAGDTLDSPGLARRLEHWLGQSRPLVFLIGGAEGLDGSVLDRCDARISLGALTWAHLLVRVMLAEQLFRAQCIRCGHPYHRAGRPS